jgi:activated CDC42 kinase 1
LSKQAKPSANSHSDGNGGTAVLRQIEPEVGSHPVSQHIISANSISLHKQLGVGEFGVVQQGVWTRNDGRKWSVAIKCLSKQRLQTNPLEFLKEAAMLHAVEHEHIVRLFGVVLDGEQLMLVTELAAMKSLLECLKQPELRAEFNVRVLCEISRQICSGMAHLESRRLIHRDLAARNILVFSRDCVKISDFGLSRALGVGKDYYQTDFEQGLRLPIAWCAPECILFLRFTSSSDVWAFAVTLWEMFSYGRQPWANLTGQQILDAVDQPNSRRLSRPIACPYDLYQLMLKCWHPQPEKRSRFEHLLQELPDCRPDLVQSVADANDHEIQSQQRLLKEWPDNQPTEANSRPVTFLRHKRGNLITVLDQKPPLGDLGLSVDCNLWLGALDCGQIGLFNPNQTVAYLGQNLPGQNEHGKSNGNHSSNGALSTSSFIRSILDKNLGSHSDKNGNSTLNKRRLKAEMISCPQGEVRHTGHVGADGVYFGDVAGLHGSRAAALTQSDHPDANSLSRNSSDLSDRVPLISQRHEKKPVLSGKKNGRSPKPITLNDIHPDPDHEYQEISDDDHSTCAALGSPKFDVSRSFLFTCLQCISTEIETNTDCISEFRLWSVFDGRSVQRVRFFASFGLVERRHERIKRRAHRTQRAFRASQ